MNYRGGFFPELRSQYRGWGESRHRGEGLYQRSLSIKLLVGKRIRRGRGEGGVSLLLEVNLLFVERRKRPRKKITAIAPRIKRLKKRKIYF